MPVLRVTLPGTQTLTFKTTSTQATKALATEDSGVGVESECWGVEAHGDNRVSGMTADARGGANDGRQEPVCFHGVCTEGSKLMLTDLFSLIQGHCNDTHTHGGSGSGGSAVVW